MKRIVLCLILAAWCAFGGEVLKDAEGRVLVPVAKIPCVPLVELKAIRVLGCKAAKRETPVFVIQIKFTLNTPSEKDVIVTFDFSARDSGVFKQGKIVRPVTHVKPGCVTTAQFIIDDAAGDVALLPSYSFSPVITFVCTNPLQR